MDVLSRVPAARVRVADDAGPEPAVVWEGAGATALPWLVVGPAEAGMADLTAGRFTVLFGAADRFQEPVPLVGFTALFRAPDEQVADPGGSPAK